MSLTKQNGKVGEISLTTELSPEIMLKCGILEEYHDKGFEDFYGHPEKWKELEPLIQEWNFQHPDKPIQLNYEEGRKLLEKIARYVRNIENARKKGISLLLAGSNGTGKTLLAVSVLKKAIARGFTGQMTSLGGIIQLYTEGWSDPEKRELFDRRIRNVDFLLIDDVGKEYQAKNSDLTEIMFDNLIRYRVFRRKPFILTTNTSPVDLRNRYGNSLMSLLEGKTLKLQVVGEDYRKLIQSKQIWQILESD